MKKTHESQDNLVENNDHSTIIWIGTKNSVHLTIYHHCTKKV